MTGDWKNTHVGSLKKGNYVIIDDIACIVSDMKISRPGKHGHAKVNLTATGMLDGKKRQTVMPGHDNIKVPIIGKKNAQVLSVQGKKASVMDMETYETFDLDIPSELDGQVSDGMTVVYWIILNDLVMKQVKNE
ncbi:translation initiation factor IF-5A [archaeon]|jgi:translation initiation factor 5A|nr:translation initiation factor IF-5A [archaeon]MBT4351189.1 translation initiation factor IF-5A [archaeon]MBT4646793.1 translation initiation factor IF-5A [archaeon]MBT6821469.1 translation initiation factor IF-5A [archaeon]MBT7392951.1 translation initiation factor IF-5A [archaeon]